MPRLSKAQMTELAAQSASDKTILPALFRFFENGQDDASAFRAAWVVSTISEKNAAAVQPNMATIIRVLTATTNMSVRREMLRIVRNGQVAEDDMGLLFEYCTKWLQDPKQAKAIHHFSLKIVERICTAYPALVPEAILVLQETRKFGMETFNGISAKTLLRWENLSE